MMSSVQKLQLWIHHHYDGIKLFLIIVTLSVVLVGIYAQGASNEQRSRENAAAIAEIQKNTESIDSFTRGVKGAVDDLKADNLNQTVILCTIILRGNLSLNENDAVEIEKICEEEVQRAINERAELEREGQSESNVINGGTPNGSGTSNQNPGPAGPAGPQGPQGPPAKEENNTPPKSALEVLTDPIVNPVRDVTCNVLSLLCRE